MTFLSYYKLATLVKVISLQVFLIKSPCHVVDCPSTFVTRAVSKAIRCDQMTTKASMQLVEWLGRSTSRCVWHNVFHRFFTTMGMEQKSERNSQLTTSSTRREFAQISMRNQRAVLAFNLSEKSPSRYFWHTVNINCWQVGRRSNSSTHLREKTVLSQILRLKIGATWSGLIVNA